MNEHESFHSFSFEELETMANEYVTLWIEVNTVLEEKNVGYHNYVVGEGSKAFDRYSLKKYGVTMLDFRNW